MKVDFIELTNFRGVQKQRIAFENKNFVALIGDNGWRFVPDSRGDWYHTDTKHKLTITEPLAHVPSGYVRQVPGDPADIWAGTAWETPIAILRERAIDKVSFYCFQKRAEIFPDYKRDNAIAASLAGKKPPYEVYTVEYYYSLVEIFRTLFYQTKSMIESATSQDEIDVIIKNIQWPVG